MSFILDALRKSESERQRLGATSIADLPLGRQRTQPWWVIALAILLAANVVLLMVVMLRPRDVPTSALPPTVPAAIATVSAPIAATPANASLAQAAAEEPQIQYETVDRSVLAAADTAPQGPTLVRSVNMGDTADMSARDPASRDVQPDQLAELHLDMHVYAQDVANRFVFINKRKYAEGQTLTEGPRIEQITVDGVVLTYRGTRWQLQRP